MATSISTLVGTDGVTTANSMTKINANFDSILNNKIESDYLDTDTTLAADSDSKIATQKAVKAYVDSGGNQNASTTQRGIVEEATDAEVAAGTATGSTGARLFISPASIRTTNIQTFTSSGTYTLPTNGQLILVKAWGAGGSGGKGSTGDGGAGGGGGGYAEKIFAASDISSPVTVTIGVGGSAQTTGDMSGTAGGNTTFGTYLTAYGGGAGGGAGTGNGGGGGGGGGTASAGSDGSTDNGNGAAGGLIPGGTAGAGGTTTAGGDSSFGGGGGGGGSGAGTTNPKTGGSSGFGGGGGAGGGVNGGVDGGDSLWGGGGGGGGYDTGSSAGGTSVHGGAGGAGATGANNATDGSVPGGGGGGSVTGNSGAGGKGKMIVITYF